MAKSFSGGSFLLGILLAGFIGLFLWKTGVPASETLLPPSQSSTNVSDVVAKLITHCPGTDKLACLQEKILELVPSEGPVIAIQAFTALIENGTVPPTSDYHDYIHKIGRATAKNFGVNTKSFFTCPTDFNYGCPHGFFEAALAENPDPKAISEMICDRSEMTMMPAKTFFYCYHGVGHGVMMAKAYNLAASLDICNSFSEADARQGCHQGVFMENIVGRMQNTTREENFSKTDLLAPCTTVGKPYPMECYINHGSYLLESFNMDVKAATSECLKADPIGMMSCLQSIGIIASNPGWQRAILPVEEQGSLTENSLKICAGFPENYKNVCYDGVVDNIGNNFKTDITNSLDFCKALPVELHEACYRRIGVAVRHEIASGDIGAREGICRKVPAEFFTACMEGMAL